MSTTATTPEITNVTAERYDVVVGYDVKKSKDADGKDVVKEIPSMYAFSSEEDQKNVKEAETAGTFKPEFTVTVSQPLAKTFEGIKQICPDEEEACNNFNRGAKQKGSNRLKATLLDVDQDNKFTFSDSQMTNGVFDLTAEIASPTKKKSLTEEEKLDRFLASFPEAVRASMKAAYTAAKAPVAA
jgi:hypothetical protein